MTLRPTTLACVVLGTLVPLGARAEGAAPQVAAPAPFTRDYDAPDPDRDWTNHLRALANVAFTNYAVFQYDWAKGLSWVYVTRSSIGSNLTSHPAWDNDSLATNLFLHPYHGGVHFASARASGLSFWESAPYAALGSVTWELFGETQVASTNDLIATSVSGIILGEALYRLSSALLDDSARGPVRLLRELGAASVSPMRGFNRLYTRTAWGDGGPPERRHPVEVAIEAGFDRLRASDVTKHTTYAPTALVAVGVTYGDLLPRAGETILAPFEFFEGYLSASLFNGPPSGDEAYLQGLLFAWSADLSKDEGSKRDNNVLGVVQSFDFQGSGLVNFGCMGVGPGDYAVWRFGGGYKLRLGLDLEWTFLSGVTSPYGADGRDYNFGMGGAVGTGLRLDLRRFGELGLRTKHYVAGTISGGHGEDVVGYGRAWYGVDVVGPVGVGISPTLIDRWSAYDGRPRVGGTSLEMQLYLRVHD